VLVPFEEPFALTLTPGMPLPSSDEVTLPVTCLVWANNELTTAIIKTQESTSFFMLFSLMNENKNNMTNPQTPENVYKSSLLYS
jgi:hypothetical protein